MTAIADRTMPPIRRLMPALQKLITQHGTRYPEPRLVFSNGRGDGFVEDPHPLRGLVQNQPYDYRLTRDGLSTTVRIGVICPRADAPKLSTYLQRLNQRLAPDSKVEYLVEYPSFGLAFGLPLDLPQPGGDGWYDCSEPPGDEAIQASATETVRHIRRGVQTLQATVAPDVVVVYVPQRWKPWEHIETGSEVYDLHDMVKAYCVQQGVHTQFLRETTLSKLYQCEILWWLALSMYVKSSRTPWLLESLAEDTTFVGLGFSMQPGDSSGNHIVVGASHLYNSEGHGLRYKLSKLENSYFIRGENPFLPKADAQFLGNNIRQLFFETWHRLPRRVVIHKRTPFHQAEREGLLEGLAGIDVVDMLEITVEPALRYVAFGVGADGLPQAEPFPVRRGTAMVLDSRTALLWVHGTADGIGGRRHYYMGKSRIPAPLMVRRHHGTSELASLAHEILGLSKMSWNSFDMYTKIPATIQSSNDIARIGPLLERFGPLSYDYRLFI